MKIKRKGRTYDDTPTPQVLDGEGQRDNYAINRVVLYFTGAQCRPVGYEVFRNSRKLMDRFNEHAKGTVILSAVWIDGEPATRNRNSWKNYGDFGFFILQGKKMLADDLVFCINSRPT